MDDNERSQEACDFVVAKIPPRMPSQDSTHGFYKCLFVFVRVIAFFNAFAKVLPTRAITSPSEY